VSEKVLLVVDDEPDNIDLVRAIVEDTELPVRFVSAINGLEAVQRARECSPRLILMDLKMPVLDGWEATRQLKADAATCGISIIALTAQALPGDRARALAAGCDEYLAKPLDRQTLVSMLRAHFV